MVGHNHEDVDQLFSRISVRASKTPAVTLPDLQAIITTSVDPLPQQQHLTHLWDFKDMATSEYKFEGFHDVYCFKLTKKESQVVLQYKDWQLQSHSNTEINITNAVPDFHPPKIADHNHQKFNSILDCMKKDLPKWTQTGRFSLANGEWKKEYLQRRQGPVKIPAVPVPLTLGKFITPKSLNNAIDPNLQEPSINTFQKFRNNL